MAVKKRSTFPFALIVYLLGTILFAGLIHGERAALKRLISYGTYYLMAALIFLWIWIAIECVRRYQPPIRDILRRNASGIIFAFIACCVIFISVTPMFRVLSDEAHLLSISKSLTYNKSIEIVSEGKWYYDTFNPMKKLWPKRFAFFPFCVYLVHTMTGFRPENVFVVNFLVLFALLCMIYAYTRSRLGNVSGYAAILLIVSQPVITTSATSGGFDLMAALWMIICIFCMRWFVYKPESLPFQLLWSSCLIVSCSACGAPP